MAATGAIWSKEHLQMTIGLVVAAFIISLITLIVFCVYSKMKNKTKQNSLVIDYNLQD